MTTQATPAEIEVTLRHVEGETAVKDYVSKRLTKLIRSLPGLRTASVEITFEHARPADKRYVGQATLAANGSLLRVEDRGPDPYSTVDFVHALLERRIRDWKGRVYYQRRRDAVAYEEAVLTQAGALLPQEQAGRIVRKKSHEIKPMFPEDAIAQMELLGHDFFFFLNAGSGQYNVLYRRKAGGYGLIEPALESRQA